MFSRWGAFVYRHRRIVLILAIALGLGSTALAGKASAELSAGGWLDPNSESQAVADRLADDFGGGRGTLIPIFVGAPGTDATSPEFQAKIADSLKDLKNDPNVDSVIGYAETGDKRFISEDGDSAYVVVGLDITDEASVPLLDRFEEELHQPTDGTRLLLAGYAPLTRDSAEQSEKDLVRAETVSLPIAAVILMLVFATVVGAGLPLLVAGLAIPSTLALVFFAAQATEISIYVQNISTMLGLALAIDYSLFMVSRFREELRRGRTVGEAVEISVATSGKAVVFSGLAVAIGLGGLMIFSAPALRSIGIGGALTVGSSVFFALTFLPALLGMLGPRVNALSIAGLRHGLRRITGRPIDDSTAGQSRWERVAHAVMARPVIVLIPTLVLLLALGTPFLRLQQGIPDANVLPDGQPSKEAALILQNDFAAGTTSPIVVLADTQGDPASPDNVRKLAAFAERLGSIDGVDAVESPFSGIPNPQTGQPMTADELVALYSMPREQWPPQLVALYDRFVKGSTVRLDALSPLQPASPEGTAVVSRVRELSGTDGLTIQVGGSAALGHDFLVAQSARSPYAVGITLLAMGAILFLLFGSVVLPIKAILMTLLSIAASFGAMVFIFQEGNFSNLLGFTSPGFTIAGNPIIMFAVIFGLSMDYEVLLLSRIQEAWRRTGDNTAAVAEGLAKTAGVITGAALIMVVVFAAFALADTITIKSIGVGMAIAVLLDATIIRVLVVPATMRLLGHWNWWAPGILGRFADRLGFSHAEDEPAGTAEPARPATGQA
jgi:putative drug exporter of the RND superfamily